MKYLLLSVPLLFLIIFPLNGENLEKKSNGDVSPSGRYYCSFNRIVTSDGNVDPDLWDITLVSKNQPNKKINVLRGFRSLEVKWSPLDNWFAILEHSDGHRTDLYVFQIVNSLIDSSISIRCVYKSPDFEFGHLDTIHWDIVSWNMSNGTIKIQCEFSGEDCSPTKKIIYDNVPFCPSLCLDKSKTHGK